MRRILKDISKTLGMKGWRFEIEGVDRFYLTKFDPVEKRNDDEYRVYFFIKDDNTIQIVRKIKIEKYKYKESIDFDNKFVIEAMKILNTYAMNHLNKTYKHSA